MGIWLLLALAACAKGGDNADSGQITLASSRQLIAGCGPPVVRTCTNPIPVNNNGGLPICGATFHVGDACANAQGDAVCVLEAGYICSSPSYVESAIYMYCSDTRMQTCPL